MKWIPAAVAVVVVLSLGLWWARERTAPIPAKPPTNQAVADRQVVQPDKKLPVPATKRSVASGGVVQFDDGSSFRFDMTEQEIERLLGKPSRAILVSWEYPQRGLTIMFGRDRRAVAFLAGNHEADPATETFQGTIAGVRLHTSREEIEATLGPPESNPVNGVFSKTEYKSRGITCTYRDNRLAHVTVRRVRQAID